MFRAVSFSASILEKDTTDHYDRKGPDIKSSSMINIALKDLINGSRIIFMQEERIKILLKRKSKQLHLHLLRL